MNSHWLREQITALGHQVTDYRLIKDEPDQAAVLDELAATPARILLWNGGTGIAPRDTTYDVLSRKLEKTLPGFGEIFRMLSFEVVGAAAMLSRATAGVYRGKLVVSTPRLPQRRATDLEPSPRPGTRTPRMGSDPLNQEERRRGRAV